MTRRGKKTKTLAELIANWCMSEWEGCMCARPTGHKGLHKCGSATGSCPRWDDAQADAWNEKLKARIAQLRKDT